MPNTIENQITEETVAAFTAIVNTSDFGAGVRIERARSQTPLLPDEFAEAVDVLASLGLVEVSTDRLWVEPSVRKIISSAGLSDDRSTFGDQAHWLAIEVLKAGANASLAIWEADAASVAAVLRAT